MQIIVGALVAGCAIFLVIVLAIAEGAGKVSDPPVTTYIAFVLAATMLVARAIVPGIVVAQARRKILAGTWKVVRRDLPASSIDPTEQDDDAGKLAQVLMVRTIIAAAILEGAVFFSLIAHVVDHSPLSLVLAVALLAALAAHFPTRSHVDRWIEGQLRLLNEERSF